MQKPQSCCCLSLQHKAPQTTLTQTFMYSVHFYKKYKSQVILSFKVLKNL